MHKVMTRAPAHGADDGATGTAAAHGAAGGTAGTGTGAGTTGSGTGAGRTGAGTTGTGPAGGAPHRPAARSATSRPPARRDPRRPGGPPRGAVPRQGGARGPDGVRQGGARGPAGRPAPGHLAGGPRTPPGAARRPAAPGSGPPRPTDLFADRLLAVLTGRRPVHSMLRHTAGSAYDELARLAEHGPLRARGPAPVVRDVGYCVPRNGAVEVFARIATGDRLSAMAFRLERGQDLRWRCTAIDLGPGT